MNLKPLISLREQIEDMDPPSSLNRKSTVLSNSKRGDEPEIGLANPSNFKFGKDYGEEISSVEDSLKKDFDHNNSDSKIPQLNDNSYANLLKDPNGNDNYFTEGEENFGTERQITTNMNDYSKTGIASLGPSYKSSVVGSKLFYNLVRFNVKNRRTKIE